MTLAGANGTQRRSRNAEKRLANTRSAEKRNRQTRKRRERNVGVRTRVKGAVKKFREAVAKGDAGATAKALLDATSTLAKAASKGVLHKNAASRRISRLAKAAAKGARAKA
jgi:small subunit ribosomal protein S20